VVLVEMVITTACDEVPGVTEVDGLKGTLRLRGVRQNKTELLNR